MLKPETLAFIRRCAREFDVRSIYLFGSAAKDEEAAGDIDLGVEGIDPSRFFDFYDRLYFGLSKPLDLINLAEDLPVVALIQETGIRIYERTA